MSENDKNASTGTNATADEDEAEGVKPDGEDVQRFDPEFDRDDSDRVIQFVRKTFGCLSCEKDEPKRCAATETASGMIGAMAITRRHAKHSVIIAIEAKKHYSFFEMHQLSQ